MRIRVPGDGPATPLHFGKQDPRISYTDHVARLDDCFSYTPAIQRCSVGAVEIAQNHVAPIVSKTRVRTADLHVVDTQVVGRVTPNCDGAF